MKKSKERLHGKVQETLRDVPLSILMKIILSYAFVWDKEKFVMAGAKIAECIYNYAEDHLDAFNDPNEDDPAEDDDTDLTEQKLANIRQKQYYYKLFAESERRRIVLKTLTKAAAWESSSCRPSSYPSIHALPLLRGEGYSMRGAGGAGPRGWGRLSSRQCFFGLHLLRLTDLTEQRDDICHTDPTDLTDTESRAKTAKEPKAQKSVRSVRSVCNNKSVRSVRSVCDNKSVRSVGSVCNNKSVRSVRSVCDNKSVRSRTNTDHLFSGERGCENSPSAECNLASPYPRTTVLFNEY